MVSPIFLIFIDLEYLEALALGEWGEREQKEKDCKIVM